MKNKGDIAAVIIVMIAASGISYGQGCTSKQVVGKSCQISVAKGGIVNTSPTGPLISWQNLNGRRVYTIRWTDDGHYTIGVKTEPDQPLVPYLNIDVYYPVGAPAIKGDSFICASKSSSDFQASTSNDNNVHDFEWVITPSNAYTTYTESGSPPGKNLKVNWNTSYTGNITVKAIAWGFGEDFREKTIVVYRKAMETFTARLSPAVVCEGQPEHISVIASHSATYKWYQDDNAVSFSNVSSPLINPPLGVAYMVTVTPSPSVECLTNPGPLPPIRTTHQNFEVIPMLRSVAITNDMVFKCNSSTPLEITFRSDGTSDYHFFSVSSNNSTSPGTVNGDVLNWNGNYTGTATITLTAHGCNGNKTDTHVITVASTPPHKSLGASLNPICANKTTTLSLTSTGRPAVPETYILTKVIAPGPNETFEASAPQTTTSWAGIPVGTYYATTVAPNCPVDRTDRFEVERITSEPVLSSSVGTLLSKTAWNTTLDVCSHETPVLSIEGATNVKWYVYNEACRTANINVLPPNKRWDYCHKAMSSFDGSSNFSIWAGISPTVVVTGEENVCNEHFEREIEFRTDPITQFTRVTPDLNTRAEGSGSTLFKMEWQGLLDDSQWTIDPPEAGAITQNGEVTWTPAFNSWQTGAFVPVTINARTKDCAGWHEHPLEIAVWPILDLKENRIRTYTPQKELRSTIAVVQQMENPLQVQSSASYFDGLGRNVQNVQYFGSPTKDIIDLKRYDEFGRETIRNLPYTETHTLDYRSSAIVDQSDFYTHPPATIPSDKSPFARTVFEPSPLNRVIEQGAPGSAFQPGTDHTIKKQYLLNRPHDVIRLNYDPKTGEVRFGSGDDAWYEANSLTCVKTIDEQQNDIMEYTDKQGRLICTKVKASADVYACTYYIYDGTGKLITVVSPEGAAHVSRLIK